MATTTDNLRFLEDLQPGAVDRVAGILRNVRICGMYSRNNRRYSEECLRAAAPLYEGVAVGIDHEKSGKRSYLSRFGVLRSVRFVQNDGLRGDLHFPANHQLAEQVCFDAEHRSPVGLSHDVRRKIVAVPRRHDRYRANRQSSQRRRRGEPGDE